VFKPVFYKTGLETTFVQFLKEATMSLTSALTFEHVMKDSGYGANYSGYGLAASEYYPGYYQDTGWRPDTGVSANTYYFKGNTATVSNWYQFHGPSLTVNHSANSDNTKDRSWFSCKFLVDKPPPECSMLWYQDVPILTASSFITGVVNSYAFRADVCVDRLRDEIRVYVDDKLVQTTPFWRKLSRQPTSQIRFGSNQKINLGSSGPLAVYSYFAIWFKDIIFYDDTGDDTLCSPVGDYNIVRLPVVNAAGTGWTFSGTGPQLTNVLNNIPFNSSNHVTPIASSPDGTAPLTYGLDVSPLADDAVIEGLFTLHNGAAQNTGVTTLRLTYKQGELATPQQIIPYLTPRTYEYGVKTPIVQKSPANVRWTKQALAQVSVETVAFR